jgi:hypothetical protein
MKSLYTTTVAVAGGRDGSARSDDGRLDVAQELLRIGAVAGTAESCGQQTWAGLPNGRLVKTTHPPRLSFRSRWVPQLAKFMASLVLVGPHQATPPKRGSAIESQAISTIQAVVG